MARILSNYKFKTKKKHFIYIVLLGVCIHIIFLVSIFDIYFKSPIMHGISPIDSPQPSPAKRLFYFVSDGLRADTFYELDENGQTRAPFLRDIIKSTGVWGICHTTMPSESRPGHVAMFSGFYEDVSAVTKGWKENPVEFDSVFNESRYSWAWGSEDILPMFKKGMMDVHMFIDMYPSDLQHYGQKDSSYLDTWVFDKVKTFFSEANNNQTLKTMLNQDKLIFFLHLLGTDVIGHSHRPHSSEYKDNVKKVDLGIQEIVDVIENYYKHDDKTSYIFTSDHGMTDWGSHGAGSWDETRLPFVAWGAGIRGPLRSGRDDVHDEIAEQWEITNIRRVDISQIDIAPFISTLIGIPIPVNSLGVLPIKFLNTDWVHKSDALITNANQILKQYYHIRDSIKTNIFPIFYSPFKELTAVKKNEFFEMLNTLQKQMRFKDAVQVTSRLIQVSLKGLEYFQKYDRGMLKLTMCLCFLGWMVYIVTLLIQINTKSNNLQSLEQPFSKTQEGFYSKIGLSLIVLAGIWTLLYAQNMPIMYYIYFFSTVILWSMVIYKWDSLIFAYDIIQQKGQLISIILTFVFSIVGLELLVYSFFNRKALSFGLLLMSIWPYLTSLKEKHSSVAKCWFILCLLTALFPMFPVVGRNSNYVLVQLSSFIMLALGGYFSYHLKGHKADKNVNFVLVLQLLLLITVSIIVKLTSDSFVSDKGLPLVNQILSWSILPVSLLLPLFGSTSVYTRLLHITLALVTPFLLLSIHYEGFFYVTLTALLSCWLNLENCISQTGQKLNQSNFSAKDLEIFSLEPNDVRRAYFFIFFNILAFFGTGNIASINSFEVSSVYCFITLFSPFIMTALLIFKILIPFLLVGCYFRAILVSIEASTMNLFLLISLMSDFMAVHFFFYVQDSGSWLDIGTSISHYFIIMCITIFTSALYGLATLYTTFTCSFPFKIPKYHSY